MEPLSIPIISVTGTKGKTTVVNALADILLRGSYKVLHVDTSGHFVNGQRRSVGADSARIWGIRTVTAMPGKYLGEFLQPDMQDSPAAVLECSFSCKTHGLGYGQHKVGVFLNVFEDHLDQRGALKTRRDLAESKSFVFSSIGKNGYAVFNADDDLVCEMLSRVPNDKNIKLIPCGVTFAHFDVQRHLQEGGTAITTEDGQVVLKERTKTMPLCSLDQVSWTFGGTFKPSVMNLLHVCGAIYGFYDGQLPQDLPSIIQATRLPETVGRLVVMRAKNGATVIGDYAHEKVSLEAIAKLARQYVKPGGKLIGVVRLAHERPDELLRETGHLIADSFDELVVYDKIDGFWRSPKQPYIKRYPQVIGRTSQVLTDAIGERNSAVARIIREDEAIAQAAVATGPNDVAVVILNDDIERSLDFIKECFKAKTI